MAMDGLRQAVNGPHATGRTLTFNDIPEPIFNAPGVQVWGKTGTATAPPIMGPDPDGPGPATPDVIEEGDHSWFVVLAGRDRPRYAIAVVIDYGGSGGKVSGPIANQIIHALIAEGYL
jgi:cell division protein FtsI/penicillin-binding protein 2